MANVVRIPPPPSVDTTDKGILNAWFNRVHDAISRINTTITTYAHNDLTSIQGGTTTERFHLTSAQVSQLTTNYLPTGTEGQTFYNNAGAWVPTNALWYDDINFRYGIGTTSPTAALHIKAGTTTAGTAPLKFTSGPLNTTQETGALEFANQRLYFTGGPDRMVIDQSENLDISTTTVSNTTTETTIDSHVLEANELFTGRLLESRHLGRFSKNVSTDYFSINIKLNGTTFASFTSDTTLAATNKGVSIELYSTCRDTGTTGHIQSYIKCDIGGVASYYVDSSPMVINTTTTNTLSTTIIWNAASVNNTVSIDQGWMTWKG